MSDDFRTQVAEEMIRHIEAGTAQWQVPWNADAVRIGPFNHATKSPYRGINAWWLGLQGRADPRWMTYRQAAEIGAQVRKGEHGTQIEYWQWDERRKVQDKDGKPVLDAEGKETWQTVRLDRPKTFLARVFNAEQIDGLELYVAPKPTFEPVWQAEAVLKLGGVAIHHDQSDRAFYRPGQDTIHLPDKAAFKDGYEYYATALHELGHATGHASRLKREFGPFGSERYAAEELRAEMASYMVTTELGLGHYPERHAGYVESWLKAIREDKTVLFHAARDAETVRSWVMEPEKRQELEQAATRRAEARTQERQEEKAMTTDETKTKVYLHVPYADKDEAKTLGARWDRREKRWFVNEGADMATFEKWRNAPAPAAAPASVISPVEEFADALKSHGLILKGPPVMNGEWHRVAVDGDRNNQKNGSYRGFLDGVPAGNIVNFKTGGDPVKWVATGAALDPAEKERLKAESAERKKERDEARKKTYQETAKKAFGVWEHATPIAGQEHPYLAKKGVDALEVRVDGKGNLLVPCRDRRGYLWNVQTISPEGEKRFLTDGRKTGLYHVIDGEKLEIDKRAGARSTVLVAEGYATAAELNRATKLPVVVAFDAGNLAPVAKAVKEKYPDAQLVIAADNDHKLRKNVGVIKATSAGKEVGAPVIVPTFSDAELTAGCTDFNDLAKCRGPAALSGLLAAKLEKALAASPKDAGKDQVQTQDRQPSQAQERGRKAAPAAKKARGQSAEMAL